MYVHIIFLVGSTSYISLLLLKLLFINIMFEQVDVRGLEGSHQHLDEGDGLGHDQGEDQGQQRLAGLDLVAGSCKSCSTR
jgi:hypothetical protein